MRLELKKRDKEKRREGSQSGKDTRKFPALHPSESLAVQMFGWR